MGASVDLSQATLALNDCMSSSKPCSNCHIVPSPPRGRGVYVWRVHEVSPSFDVESASDLASGFSGGRFDYLFILRSSLELDRGFLTAENEERTCSYGELRERWSRVAAGLQRRGLGPHPLACVHAANCLDMVFAIGGTFFAGGSVVFYKASCTPRECRHTREIAVVDYI
ncbi:hypothetical protein HPB48_001550 [Haemaphysalis longicornis]|uniref:AMP-dependent synthetase/ligase domain-containing protein n=1 Tax=Haemaphysalis longicornis TaxID=44386 RepID=A0A9J6FFR5_HAELO|nr:hypothetical protein HPB48_001550 [Haemaphysalis longicornis]